MEKHYNETGRENAWIKVNELFGTDYRYDDGSTERAGYPIYRDNCNYSNYVCDLGDRFELNFSDGSYCYVHVVDPAEDPAEVPAEDPAIGINVNDRYHINIGTSTIATFNTAEAMNTYFNAMASIDRHFCRVVDMVKKIDMRGCDYMWSEKWHDDGAKMVECDAEKKVDNRRVYRAAARDCKNMSEVAALISIMEADENLSDISFYNIRMLAINSAYGEK